MAFINERELASKGQMSLRFAADMEKYKSFDFYKTGTGDKASGKFIRRTLTQIVIMDEATDVAHELRHEIHTFDLIDGVEQCDDKDMQELVEDWCDKHGAHHFEGDAGLQRFNNLCAAIGYVGHQFKFGSPGKQVVKHILGHQFKFGSPLEHFLSDNPGAIEAVLEWIVERGENCEWKSALESELESSDEETCIE